jgi:hypothetical protein
MSRACARTTEPRIHTRRSDDGSAKCRALSRPARPSAFSAYKPPFTTLSTSNVTLSLAARFACSGRKLLKRGRKRPLRRDAEDRACRPMGLSRLACKRPRPGWMRLRDDRKESVAQSRHHGRDVRYEVSIPVSESTQRDRKRWLPPSSCGLASSPRKGQVYRAGAATRALTDARP